MKRNWCTALPSCTCSACMRDHGTLESRQAKSFIAGAGMKPQGIVPSIALCNPKYARNVSMAIRLASCYGFKQVWYSGDRVSVDEPEKNQDYLIDQPKSKSKARLPREERMKGYNEVELRQYDKFFDHFPDAVPVAIELKPGAEMLHNFVHPDNALYVFGPEDGGIDKMVSRHCHRFVVIPTRHCLNLATAIATVLWDRKVKRLLEGKDDDLTMDELLAEDRGMVCGDM